MNQKPTAFLHRLFPAAGSSGGQRQQEALLLLVSALVSGVGILWFFLYQALGVELSLLLPIGLVSGLSLNYLIYRHSGDFARFRRLLLTLLLIFPFLAQCALGGFEPASGIVLWGLLAPLGALLCLGVSESAPWFLACVLLTLLAGVHEHFQPIGYPVSQSVVSFFFALNFSALSILIYLSLRFAIGERNRTLLALEDAHLRLAEERAKAERLLLNILPAPIAERLKAPGAEVADAYPKVTVMFADIVNFTQLASHMEASSVFALLNEVFGKFDELTEAHGLEKIKTIGDAYMVAGGLNARTEGKDPEQAIAELALAMRDWLARAQLPTPSPLHLRIGISSGPVIAGVVGKQKFTYDLWGDTVNLAHRITSESMPDTIFCDSRTFLHLKYRFVFEDPVTLRLKGKGMVSVWNLLGPPKPRASAQLDLDLSL